MTEASIQHILQNINKVRIFDAQWSATPFESIAVAEETELLKGEQLNEVIDDYFVATADIEQLYDKTIGLYDVSGIISDELEADFGKFQLFLLLEQIAPKFRSSNDNDFAFHSGEFLNFRGRDMLRELYEEPYDEYLVESVLPSLFYPKDEKSFIDAAKYLDRNKEKLLSPWF